MVVNEIVLAYRAELIVTVPGCVIEYELYGAPEVIDGNVSWLNPKSPEVLAPVVVGELL